jgi:hypothetical protein
MKSLRMQEQYIAILRRRKDKMKILRDTIEFYKWLWSNLNKFGKIVFFPMAIILSPVIFLIALAVKGE